MSNRERVNVLRATKELAGWDDAHLRGLLPFLDEACVPPGTVLAEAGRLCHQFVIVVWGVRGTCRDGRSGGLGGGGTFGGDARREPDAHEAPESASCAGHR